MTTQTTELLDDFTFDPQGDLFTVVLPENASRIKAESLVPFLQDFLDRVKVATGFCDADVLRAIALLPQFSSLTGTLDEAASNMLLDWVHEQMTETSDDD